MASRFTPERIDFTALVRPRPLDAAGAIDADDTPTPATFRAKARRAAMFKDAGEVVRLVPAPGEALHAVMSGTYDLMMVLVAILDRLGCPCEAMRIATLSFNKRNCHEILAQLDSGKVGRFSLLCSEYFRDNDSEVYQAIRQELVNRSQRLAACRNHCKVVTMSFADGTRLVLEGSANLRRNGNTEQFCLIHDAPLHDWHAAWIDALVNQHESDQSGSSQAD
jgi:hypothetical protein